MRTWLAVSVMAALLTATAAQAQTATAGVWRCGIDGRSYSDTPCPGGTELALADPRSPAQTQAAREWAQREARLGEQMVRERELREKQAIARPAAPTTSRTVAARKALADAAMARSTLQEPGQKARRRPAVDDGTWRAVGPSTRPTKG